MSSSAGAGGVSVTPGKDGIPRLGISPPKWLDEPEWGTIAEGGSVALLISVQLPHSIPDNVADICA